MTTLKKIFLYSILFAFSTFSLAGNEIITEEFSFDTGSQTWIGDFTDYPVGQENFYDLSWGWENLPSTNNPNFKKGIFLSGNNHSDDLFMYIKTQLHHLKKNTYYAVTASVDLASDVPVGSMGAGGAQGESVYIKIGAATAEPNKVIMNGDYQLNIDKGNQQQDGKNAFVVGNLANPLVDPDHPQFALLHVDNISKPLIIKSDEHGKLWVFVGTDSGFEGITKYYIGKITINLIALKTNINGISK